VQAGDSNAARRRPDAPIWSQAAERFPPADRVLSTILTRQAAQYRDRTLFVFGETRWSYAETAAIAAASAARLMQAGIQAGDRVALMCSNRPEFLEIYLGCAWMGAVTVPISTALRGIQLSHILRNSTPKLLVIESGFMPAIETLENDVAPPDLIWTIGNSAASSVAPGSITPLPALGEGASPAPVRPDDTVAILYTSGTTGPSKGICCPQAQLFWWGVYSARALGIRESDVLFTTLPLFHTNALNAFYQALLNGCTYALEPKFSASGFWAAARRHQATIGYLLGAMAVMLLAQPKSADDTAHFLRVALGGGVPGQFHGPFLASACRCSTATARPKRISCSQARFRPIVPAPWAIWSRAWRPASSGPTMSLSRTVRPASCCYDRASRWPSRQVISKCRTRRPKRGEISGFIPAIGWCAMRMATTASSTG